MYIIDGHNLIGKLPDISLRDLDDELELVKRLQEFARLSRKKVEVYFDDAPPGRQGTKTFGTVKAHFVLSISDADSAIAARLSAMQRQAKSLTVVSSDHRVQSAARRAGAVVMSSEEFIAEMSSTGSRMAKREDPSVQPLIDPDELLQMMGIDPAQADQPIEPPPGNNRQSQGPKAKRPQKKRPYHGFPQSKKDA